MSKHSRGSLFAGAWHRGSGEPLQSQDPATGEVMWAGNSVSAEEVAETLAFARSVVKSWRETPLDGRMEVIKQFAGLVQGNRQELATLISTEVGKPTWEALSEVDAVVGKAGATIEAFQSRIKLTERASGASRSVTRFRPLGLVSVIGPFNFPIHMPNGHIMPALLSGNAVIWKPSEFSPAVTEAVVELWQEAGLPDGVLSMVQGGPEVGRALVAHHEVDGVYFTGSLQSGIAISETLASTPWRIAALEMGGNSPLVVWDYADIRAALYTIVFSAFVTAGQRCSAARRLIVDSADETLLGALCRVTERIRIGRYSDVPEPFMGPMIRRAAALALTETQARLEKRGGKVLVRAELADERSALVSPGIVDVTGVALREDEEILGPLLQVIRVGTFGDAMAEANATQFGLAAGLVSRDEARFREFLGTVRAGVINWNQPLPGASPLAPFGGIKASGNNRPSGFFAVDYCSYPVASLESSDVTLPGKLPPGLVLDA